MKKIFLSILKLLSPADRFQLLGIALLSTVAALWEVIGIGLMIPVVAAIVNPELLEQNFYLRKFYELSPFQEHNAFMVYTAVLTVINFLLKNLFTLWVIKLQSTFIFRKQQEWSDQLFRKFLAADYAFLSGHTPAELSADLSRVQQVCEGTLLPVLLIIADALAAAALLGALLWFMPMTLSAALAALVVLALIFYLPFRAVNGRLSMRFVSQDNAAAAEKIAVFSGIKAVKSGNCEDFFACRYNHIMQCLTQISAKLFYLGQIPRLGLEFLAVLLAMGIFVAMLIGNVPRGTIVLEFALLIAAMGRLLPALSRLHYNLTRIRQVGALFDSLMAGLFQLPAETEVVAGSCEYHLKNVLSVNDLKFAYPDGRKIFDSFNLLIPAGTSCALVGPTGSGKSTLADLIAGLLKPSGGTITFDGQNIAASPADARAIIGYVPQFVYITAGTVRENVALGCSGAIDENKLQRALKLANLTEWVESLPEKTYTVLGENAVTISGGQRQRLGIARALYRDIELLILDEATSALDQNSENAIVETLVMLQGSLTMIVIAHRLSTIENCDKVIEIGK